MNQFLVLASRGKTPEKISLRYGKISFIVATLDIMTNWAAFWSNTETPSDNSTKMESDFISFVCAGKIAHMHTSVDARRENFVTKVVFQTFCGYWKICNLRFFEFFVLFLFLLFFFVRLDFFSFQFWSIFIYFFSPFFKKKIPIFFIEDFCNFSLGLFVILKSGNFEFWQ